MDLLDLRNNFSSYHDFYISAKEKSFSKAYEKYGITISTLSRNVSKLETLLDLKLITTNNTGFKLTIDGERLFAKLDTIFNSDIFKSINYSDNLDVTITIGTTRNIADFTLSKYIVKFNKIYPNIKISIITDSATNLNTYLLNRKIDILIDYLPHINTSQKYNLEIKTLSEYQTCFACSKQYYNEINKKINSLNDLSNYDLIISGSSRRRQMLDDVLQKYNVNLNPIMQMPDSKLMADVLKSRNSIGYFIENEIQEYDLVKLNIKEELPSNIIGVIYPKKTINSVALDFVNILFEK